MDNQKVSVVIPVYNSEKFVEKSLDSILNQTYSDYEIICVNDGSTDGTDEILQQYSDKIITISQKNQGLASALNKGIEKMNGRWFKWFSPDDVMYPETLETLVNVGKKHPNTIIYSNWDIIDENGKKLRSFSETYYNDLDTFDFNVRLLDGQQINVNTALAPRSIFDQGFKMNETIDPVLVDYDFFLRSGLFYNFKFFLIQQQLIQFRVHKSQLSHLHIVEDLDNLKKTKNEILSKLDINTRKKYLNSLQKFSKTKSISRKTMEIGLNFISCNLPSSSVNKILVFYLNKIRRRR